jgi:hypothetical protein
MRNFPFIVLLLAFLAFVCMIPAAAAQTPPRKFEIGMQVVSLEQRAFSEVDCGFGGRFTFYPISHIGLETEFDFFPRNLGKTVAFSSHRSEALFGVKAGFRSRKFGAFGRLRPGLIHFNSAPQGIACVAILVYPPPLECATSTGKTNFALDLGGGFETFPSRWSVIRLDLGDTMIRFAGPALTKRGAFTQDFNVHNFQLNVGFGIRF